jgi:hypothetical protein
MLINFWTRCLAHRKTNESNLLGLGNLNTLFSYIISDLYWEGIFLFCAIHMMIVYQLVMDVVGRSRFWSNSPSWVWMLK